jgi:hypothetical protein
MGSNETRGMDVRLRFLFVLPCVVSGLATGLILSIRSRVPD